MDGLPPHVTAYTDRHGKTRYRFRRRGMPSRSLPGQPGEDRFAAAYEAALDGRPRRPNQREKFQPKTLAAAWAEVRSSIDWKQMKASTQYAQSGIAERFLRMPIAPGSTTTFGQMPFAGLRRADVKRILARYGERQHAGEGVLRLLRKLCLVALDNEWIENDPTHRVSFRPEIIGHRAWTDAELEQFRQRWPIGTTQRLGFTLALYTGQRRGDVATMLWMAYDGEGIAVKQEKGGAPLWIPVHPVLKEVLDFTQRRGAAIIASTKDAGFAKEAFGNFMKDAIRAAGLPEDCRLHGLRKSAGRSLAEAGATTRQIMAVLGHKTLSEAERYTREVEQRMLAQQGMDSWARPRFAVVPK